MKKIAVIGAGIAGLACARVLTARGFDVQVFDKGRGPGGRMSTRRALTELGEVSFDHGAQYFTARDPSFVTEIERLTRVGAVGIWTGNHVKCYQDGTNSPLADDKLYVGTPGMNGVVRALAEGLTLFWATRVGAISCAVTDAITDAITGGATSWRLESETGVDLGVFDQIVGAIPAEQVAPLFQGIAPELSAQSQAINSLPCWTGMFAFDHPLSLDFDAMRFVDHSSVDFIAVNHSKPCRSGPASYVVQARADWSQAHLEEPAETIAETLAEALLVLSDNQPKLVASAAHRWRYARVEVSHGPGYLWDSGQNIGLCGDWLSGPRVESAWLSGHCLGLAMTGRNMERLVALTRAGG